METRTKTEILKLVESEGVDFIRLQFTDMFGTLKNVAITAGQLERALDNQFTLDGSSLFHGVHKGDEDICLYPDRNTFAILPWRPQQGKVARLLCDVRRADGSPLAFCSRSILRRTLAKAQEKGYLFYVHPECEFFLFHTDENGIPTTLSHEQAGLMDVGPIDLGENARRDMVLTLEEMGFEIESSHHEAAPAQHEIDFKQAEALETADRIVTFKAAVRSTAKRFGLHATFMPKPRAGMPGSGMHLKVSLFRDGKNLFSDPGDQDGLSDAARHFMGGVMAHAKALSAVTNPLVNSYKRLMSGFDAPRDIIWTNRNQNTLLRVPARRGEELTVELRFPDPAANPYLALAVCLAAGMDGIEKGADPGSPAAVRYEERTDAEKAAAGVDHLPETLREAIAFMERDDFLKTVLGGDFVQDYVTVKKEEWNEYMSQVSEWEVSTYLYRM